MKTLIATILLASDLSAGAGVRLKELVSFEGARENQLVGYGLVVGLNGTGDKRQTVFSAQSLTNMLERLGVTVPATALLVRNTAAVIVTANLPAFAQPGVRIDATAAAIGDAANLQGGMLVLTPLKAADGQVYAVAQGAVVTGGFVAGRGGNSQTVNHPTVGRIPSGAIVERAPPSLSPASSVRLQLRRADFTTAARIAAALNQRFASTGPPVARAEHAGAVAVNEPAVWANRHVEFLSEIENITVDADAILKVIVNERTGTIVMGKDVRIRPSAILHGGLAVEIRTTVAVSQPNALAGGTTQVIPQTTTSAKEDRARSVTLEPGATVEDLVRGLTAIGSTPRDIIAILQSLKSAGALDAEIEVI
jgi:flagellar P-ring protein precursor FlgI